MSDRRIITIPDQWTRPETSPLDFIIVGAGAGGAPLAARLAERGFTVAVIEMGPKRPDTPADAVVENTQVPLLHPETTEDPRHSLRYFARHFDGDPRGSRDPKLDRPAPDSTNPHPEDEHGIFYPRAQGVGGCTIHNAMIAICGPSEDWDEIAEATGDENWRGHRMRPYFERIERCHYARPTPLGRLKEWIGLGNGWENARHGDRGWLHTTTSDLGLLLSDKRLLKIVLGASRGSLESGAERLGDLLRAGFRGRALPALDPNHWETMRRSQAGLSQIPCSITTTGERSGPRERLLEAAERPGVRDRLHLITDALVTEILFDDSAGAPGDVDQQKTATKSRPRATGVHCILEPHLYEADARARRAPENWQGQQQRICCRREVILCGGAFNTPQLLMLSGIGPEAHLKAQNISTRVCLPAVGRNLQDRYEVPVICTVTDRFRSLDGLALTSLGPAAERDPALKRWIQLQGASAEKRGVYATNGGLIGIFYRTQFEDWIPDLFIFALAGDFPGYRVGWSRPDRLAPGGQGGAAEHKRRLTWLVLKARSRQRGGTVRLRDASPFRRPDINFDSFPKGLADEDLRAVAEGVEFVKDIIAAGIQKGLIESVDRPEDDGFGGNVHEWIMHTAWGHHACGTCRIGSESDDAAVVDSRFRVRKVDGLRVVDASIFPQIPGYFIVTNIYMVAEKAADVITEDHRAGANEKLPNDVIEALTLDPVIESSPEFEDRRVYPQEVEAAEAKLVASRRHHAGVSSTDADRAGARPWIQRLPSNPSDSDIVAPASNTLATQPTHASTLPPDSLGLALSGGGIRSASFALGVVQALARAGWLPHVDFLSTVSGGGYTGAFLGRFFDNCRRPGGIAGSVPDRKPGAVHTRVVKELGDCRSPAIAWLRQHANYLAPSGTGEVLLNIAAFWRNFLTVHFVLATFFLAAFGVVGAVGYAWFDGGSQGLLGDLTNAFAPISGRISGDWSTAWAVLAELVLWFAVVPLMIAYWLVSQDEHEAFVAPVLAVTALLALAILAGFASPLGPAILAAAVFWALEAWIVIRRDEGQGRPTSRFRLALARNHLTHRLALWAALLAMLVVLALIDGIGQGLARLYFAGGISATEAVLWIVGCVIALVALAMLLRAAARAIVVHQPDAPATQARRGTFVPYLPTVLTFIVGALMPLTLVSFVVHAAYGVGYSWWRGAIFAAVMLAVTLLLGSRPCLPFVNRSGPLAIYAARLARTFLGAVNPARRRHLSGRDVTHLISGDDVPFEEYRPDQAGGPLHLINCSVNETIDVASQRGQRDRQAESLAVGPVGVQVGRRWHALWRNVEHNRIELAPVADGVEPHPLRHRKGDRTVVERLNLREWMAISGAAVSPGMGRHTGTARALLFTLANLRLGYWWNSGLWTSERDVPFRTGLLRVLAGRLSRALQAQQLLLAELRGRFGGPWQRYWYLSDGGNFENTGAYELLRRRIPCIIVCDAGQDRTHQGAGLATLMRLARIDFGACFEEVPGDALNMDLPERLALRLRTMRDLLPADGGPAAGHAVLFRVTFPDHDPRCRRDPWRGRRTSWLLYIKATCDGDEDQDINTYRAQHPDFPNEPTEDQFFDEPQWESYRRLGEHIGERIFI